MRQRGFTIIEALVAMVVASSVCLALYAWVNASILSLDRSRAAFERSELMRQADNLLATVNVLDDPEGTHDFVGGRVHWRAFPLEGPADGFHPVTGAYADFRIGLFEVVLTLELPDGETSELVTRRTGWERTRFDEGL